jgi:hypothetical protein
LWKEFYWEVDDCAGGMFAFSISPNPADEVLTISVDYDEASEGIPATPIEADLPISLKIYDGNRNVVLVKNGMQADMLEVDISGISPGLYYVHISALDQAPCKKQLVIQ